MPKETLRDSKKTHPRKIQLETHYPPRDRRMSDLGLLLLSKLPTREVGVAGRGSEYTNFYSEENPEVNRTPLSDKRPPKTFNNDGCLESYRRSARDDRIALINERRPEVSQKPAPYNEPPLVSLPSNKGRHGAFQTPRDTCPVITISANEGDVGDSKKLVCGSKHPVHALHNREEPPEASHSASHPGKNLSCNGTPPETFPKASCGDGLRNTLSSSKKVPEASQETLRVDKRPANTISNTKAQPGAFHTPRGDSRPVHTISRTRSADAHPKTSLSSNERHTGASGTPQCNNKHPVITLFSNEGQSEASQKPLQGCSDDRRPMNAPSCKKRSTEAFRKLRPVHTASSNESSTENPQKTRSDGRPVKTLFDNNWCPEAAHKLDHRPVISGNYTARGENQHVEMQKTEASAAPQDAPRATSLADSGNQSNEMCRFRSVPSKFSWIFKYPKFQRDIQRSYMVETSFSGAKKGLFIKGKKEDVVACTNYLKTMAEQWRQWDM
ncbi:hypothetical protein E2C01_057768 [Portunus trituberculatus]|uniref:Uncharacterized protein n=1 Tax=Portunus trituberculatus TaxID=210409 RepID=A0A5B7H2X2_PORTR|nr:hypothetical protein [Portunus trituberculatus]